MNLGGNGVIKKDVSKNTAALLQKSIAIPVDLFDPSYDGVHHNLSCLSKGVMF